MQNLLNKKTFIFWINFFFKQPEEVLFRSIASILKLVSGRYYSPRGKSILGAISNIKSNKVNKLTLGGCYIEKVNETVLINREN